MVDLTQQNSKIDRHSREIIATFYLHLMSVEKDIVLLLNKCHKRWLEIKSEYETADQTIERDNVTRRIPEHLDEEDKVKFELIRQGSSFQNEAFYKHYIEPEQLEITRRQSSEHEGEEFKFEELDHNEYDEIDEFDDDLDSLLLSTPSVPALTRD